MPTTIALEMLLYSISKKKRKKEKRKEKEEKVAKRDLITWYLEVDVTPIIPYK